MKRQIVKIDEEKCNGCGLCVPACAEGAIQIIDGKARLLAENLCDGLGACLGDCPEDAILIEERDADEFDETAVEEHLKEMGRPSLHVQEKVSAQGGCPSAKIVDFTQQTAPAGGCPSARLMDLKKPEGKETPPGGPRPSQLAQWPIQMHLVPPTAPFLQDADVMLTADCAPFAMAGFHEELLKGKALLIACPKLDDTSAYVDKLVAMIQQSNIRTLTVVHMEVPCCTGLIFMAKEAIARSGRDIPLETVKIGIQGEIK